MTLILLYAQAANPMNQSDVQGEFSGKKNVLFQYYNIISVVSLPKNTNDSRLSATIKNNILYYTHASCSVIIIYLQYARRWTPTVNLIRLKKTHMYIPTFIIFSFFFFEIPSLTSVQTFSRATTPFF